MFLFVIQGTKGARGGHGNKGRTGVKVGEYPYV